MTHSLAFTDAPHRAIGPERPVVAVLGPTNTGKTHYAIERMLAYRSGMIGLPLRLLAREIYDRLLTRRPAAEVALMTGEEKIIPRKPRYWVCTVEAMPLTEPVEFMAIDEIQLAATPERGRVFTSRLLHARGTHETLFLGSDTMAPLLRNMFPNISFLGRERFSTLSWAGPKKVTRLPRRSAIVAFSSDTVYSIAELVRRQRGGAAVVLGALSPRTRNAQAALYQEGEVDYLVATDAIGMGLNMDIDHVAFAARRKFDGRTMRNLMPAEAGQIAGRAGRHMRDGTFGTTGDCLAFEEELIEAIEDHQFDPVAGLYWRSEALDFASVPALLRSLDRKPPRAELVRARPDDDERSLSILLRDEAIADIAKGGAALSLLWEVCQLPDFRKISIDQHTQLIGEIYTQIMHREKVSEDWLAPRVERLDRTDGDIDTLSARIAHIRSWTYLSHRSAWVENANTWQERARAIEDRLSDALHELLTKRFVDRRTSVLLKRLKDETPLLAGVNEDGEVIVEGQFVGRLQGFEFILDPRATGANAKPVRAAAERALQPILASRASELANAASDELTILPDGAIKWRDSIVARLAKGPAPLRPELLMQNADAIPAVLRARIYERLGDWFAARVEGLLGPMISLQQACDATGDDALSGVTRGVAFRLVENFGAVSRTIFGDELKQIGQEERAKLRKLGMRFGEYTLFMPALLKPAPAQLLTLLWALWNDKDVASFPAIKAGLVSTEINDATPHAFYYSSGYRPSGKRAVRIDMLERLAGEIRKARELGGRDGFEATSQMMSLVGCSGEEFESILMSLNFRKNTVKRKVEQQPTSEETTKPATPDTSETPGALPQASTETPLEQTPTPSTATPPEDKPNEEPAASDPVPEESAAAPVVEASPQIQEPKKEHPQEHPQEQANPPSVDATSAENTATGESSASAPAPSGEDDSKEDSPEEVEVTLWRYQARRNPRRTGENERGKSASGKAGQNRNRARGKDGDGGKGRYKGNKGGKDAKGARGGKSRDRVQNPHMHKPRHLKTADPDSPFAVLAALKDDDKKS